jgi:hypothetical protein
MWHIVKMILLFALYCRLLSRVAAVTSPTGIPQCPPTPTHHARPISKPLQDQEMQLYNERDQIVAAAGGDLGITLK